MENKSKEEVFLNKLRKEKDVQWDEGGRSGYIKRNGIEIIFKCEPTCISQKVKLAIYPIPETLETFLKLADNGFGREQLLEEREIEQVKEVDHAA